MEPRPGASWALVLGGSSGLGFACAKRLVEDGYRVFVVFREAREEARGVEERLALFGSAVRFLNADAVSEKGIQKIVEALSEVLGNDKISVVIHSIACGSTRSLLFSPRHAQVDGHPGLTAEDLRLTVDAMGLSLYAWVHELGVRGWFAHDTRIIALTSEGTRRSIPGYAAVSAAKSALESVVRSIAVELGKKGLRANAIQAGITDTRSLRLLPKSDHLLANALRRNPLGRLTVAEDVGNVVSLLCRPEAAWINGAVIPVDGGEHLC